MKTTFIAGNWKMYKSGEEVKDFAWEFKKIYVKSDVRVAICAPYVHLPYLVEEFKDTGIMVGAQNMFFEDEGAFTGEVSGKMLKNLGVDLCIIGHSERRQYFGETDESVNKKLHSAYENQLIPILCVGEILEDRDSGKEFTVVEGQVKEALKGLSSEQVSKLVIAYEPVWAIGTGRTASPDQADEMCGFIRKVVEELYDGSVAQEVTIQYGGSVKAENATELMNMQEIDGALVGGASLKPESFLGIVNF